MCHYLFVHYFKIKKSFKKIIRIKRSQTKNKTKLNQSEFTYSLLENECLMYKYRSEYECTELIVRSEYKDKWSQKVINSDK